MPYNNKNSFAQGAGGPKSQNMSIKILENPSIDESHREAASVGHLDISSEKEESF